MTRFAALLAPAALLALAALPATGLGQTDDPFPEPYDSEPSEAEPMPPELAAAAFERTGGFAVNVFAAEPDVRNPIDMAFDGQGRLWIAENYTYAERSQKFDLSLRDRVVVLEDRDRDGVADARTVFTDDVQMLTSVEVGRGGVWLMCPDKLLFFPDADADLVPDGPPQVVLDGFTVADENYHNFANGLRFGPDGWLYGRCGGSCPGRIGKPGTPIGERTALEGGIWRYHTERETFEVLCHGTTNPWGHDFDAFGNGFFINTVNGHLWHLISGAHFRRPFTLDPNPHVYELIDQHADHYHFDTGGAWNESRDGAANEYGGGHAHAGLAFARGSAFPPELQGSVLTWNFHGRRLNCDQIERRGSGFVGLHEADLLLAGDAFFRGMELMPGPDDALYAIDWSDTGECHEHTGVHRTSGRVYRMTRHDRPQPFAAIDNDTSSRELCGTIASGNRWAKRQAMMEISRRFGRATSRQSASQMAFSLASVSSLTLAVGMQRDHSDIETRAALDMARWSDMQMQSSDLDDMLADPDERMRALGVRLFMDRFPNDGIDGRPQPTAILPLPQGAEETYLSRVASRLLRAAGDESGLVRLQVASAMCRMPADLRGPIAAKLMDDPADADDHNLPLMVWYAMLPLAEQRPQMLAEVGVRSKWPLTQRLIARRLATLSDDQPQALATLLNGAAEADEPTRRNILTGVSEGFRGWGEAKQPTSWSDVVRASQSDGEATLALVRDLGLLFGGSRDVASVVAIVRDESAEISLRRSALESLVERSAGPEVEAVCLAVLGDPRLNVPASRGLAKSSDPSVAAALVKNYRRFRSPQRPKVIAVLTSRASFAHELLDAVERGHIPAEALTAYDVRQMRAIDDAELNERLGSLWGDVRETPAEKQEQMKAVRRLVETATDAPNLSAGRSLFAASCAKCHRIFGEGENIGPDLTGANRSNMDYLLENIIHPAAVVSKDYRMTVLLTGDGRVLSGLVIREDGDTLTMQTQTEKVTVAQDAIESRKLTEQSPMPEGLLKTLSDEQVVDLFGYLRSPVQVPLAAD